MILYVRYMLRHQVNDKAHLNSLLLTLTYSKYVIIQYITSHYTGSLRSVKFDLPEMVMEAVEWRRMYDSLMFGINTLSVLHH